MGFGFSGYGSGSSLGCSNRVGFGGRLRGRLLGGFGVSFSVKEFKARGRRC